MSTGGRQPGRLKAALAAANRAAAAFDAGGLRTATDALHEAAAGLAGEDLDATELMALRAEVAAFGNTCAFLGHTLGDALVRAGALPAAGYHDPGHAPVAHTRPMVERYG